MLKHLNILCLVAAGGLLQACVTTAPNQGTIEPAAEPTSAIATAGEGSALEADISERSIPDDSLLPLITAEFALREKQFDRALAILTEQALTLNDAELTRRALRLAEFRQRPDLVLPLAMQLTQLDPQDAAAAVTAMGLLINTGDIGQALAFARKAKQRGARINAPALLLPIKQLPPEGRQALTKELKRFYTDWPMDNDIAIALALAERENQALTDSLATITEVLNRDPDDERALILQAQLLLQTEQSEPFTLLVDAIERNPEKEGLKLQAARLMAANNHSDTALKLLQNLVEQSPDNGEYVFALALVQLDLEDLAAAEASLTSALTFEERADEANYYLGRIAEDRDDYERAIGFYSAVGPIREMLSALQRAGSLAHELGGHPKVSGLFDLARERHPGEAERLFVWQAQILTELDEPRAALAAYTDGLALFPDSLPLRYGRAVSYEERNDLAAAESDFRTILSADPDNVTTLNALGYALTLHSDRFDEAAELIERAIALSPGEPAILDSLGWVYFKLGRNHEALSLLNEAFRLFPDPEVAAHLGEVLWVLGRADDAAQIWRSALERSPGDPLVTGTLERLGVVLD